MSGVRLLAPLLALVLVAAGDAAASSLQEEVAKLATRARELQTPEQALSRWGRPRQQFNEFKPLFVYDPRRPSLETVELRYAPKNEAPRRLQFIDVIIWNQAFGENEVRAWLGEPSNVEKDPRLGPSGGRWIYSGKDRAELGVVHVAFDTAAAERARSLSRDTARPVVPTVVIRLDGQRR
jgi:hypothetical protein